MAYLDNVYAVVQIAPTGIPTYVRLSQNENGRVLKFAVSGDALPAGSTIVLTGTKPDGAVYSASGTLADNVATFNEDEQLTAVAGEWDAKVEVTNSGNLIATGRIKFVIDADPSGGNIPSDSQLDGYIAEMLSLLDAGKAEAYGSPLVASTVAGMIDQSRVYVYTGSETGYTAGNWYYWNGSAWTSGGVYNSVAINTDTTLSVAGMAADAKATGDAINGLETRLGTAEEDITELKDDLSELDEYLGHYKESFVLKNQTQHSSINDQLYLNVEQGDTVRLFISIDRPLDEPIRFVPISRESDGTEHYHTQPTIATGTTQTSVDYTFSSFGVSSIGVYIANQTLSSDLIVTIEAEIIGKGIIQYYDTFCKKHDVFAWLIGGSKFEANGKTLKFGNTLNLRFDNDIIDFSVATICQVAEDAGATVDYSTGTITLPGNNYNIYANVKTQTLSVTDTFTLDEKTVLLYGYRWGATFGLLKDLNYANFASLISDNTKAIKRFNTWAYISNGKKVSYSGNKLTIADSLNVRPTVKSGKSGTDITVQNLLTLAQNAGLTVDSNTNTITFSNVCFLYLDILTDTFGFSTVWIDDPNKVLLFGYNYGSTFGMLKDYATAQETKDFESLIPKVPDYFTTHLSTKIGSIRENMISAGNHGETFVFITDIHWDTNDRNSPILVETVLDKLNINLLLCGGDIINEGTYSNMTKDMNECIRAYNFKNTFFPCAFGNHDSNKNNSNPQADWFDEDAEYALMQKQAEQYVTYFTSSGWNFYFDYPASKTRFIVVDTQENGAFSWYSELAQLLNQTPDGYHVIVSGHWFYNSGSKSTFASNLESIVDAFNNKTTVTISSTTYDFSSSNGDIPFIIGGHMHKDMDWATTDGTPFILTDCDNGIRTANTDYPYVKGTITEQCFDVVTVDYDDQTIECVRIGRGADRSFSYGT